MTEQNFKDKLDRIEAFYQEHAKDIDASGETDGSLYIFKMLYEAMALNAKALCELLDQDFEGRINRLEDDAVRARYDADVWRDICVNSNDGDDSMESLERDWE